MLWLALHLPTLPLDALLVGAAPEEGVASPRCVVEQRGVVLSCAQAAAAGVQPGMSVATAASLAPGLQALLRDPQREAALVQRLTLALARYTPHLVSQPDGVLLEAAGSLRLFGGARALWRSVRDTARDIGVAQVRIAAAPTATAAGLLARVATSPPGTRAQRGGGGREGRAGPLPGGLTQRTRQALDALPLAPALAALQLPPRLAELLHGIGCRTLVDVRALPRTGLQRRGGAVLQQALDRAYGDAPDPQSWFEPPLHFELGLELLHRADDAPSLVFAAERLVPSLAGWLAQQWRAATRVSLHLRHERSLRRAPQPDTVVRVEFGQPSRNPAQLLLLLRERLQRTPLPSPVYALALRLDETISHAGREALLWSEAAPADEEHRALLDRLVARLGADHVQRPVLRADHRPEQATALEPAALRQGGVVAFPTGPPRPIWLLSEPLRLSEQGGRPLHDGAPLALRSRAERIEAGWFDGVAVSRDYHLAEGRDHRLRWVFRERRGGVSSWYLHGLFG